MSDDFPPLTQREQMLRDVAVAAQAEVAARDAIVEELRATTTALGWVTTAFRKIDEGTHGSPPHVSADNAEVAYERGMSALRDYDALTGRCCGGGRAPCPTHYADQQERVKALAADRQDRIDAEQER
jgi:hypothetical protein